MFLSDHIGVFDPSEAAGWSNTQVGQVFNASSRGEGRGDRRGGDPGEWPRKSRAEEERAKNRRRRASVCFVRRPRAVLMRTGHCRYTAEENQQMAARQGRRASRQPSVDSAKRSNIQPPSPRLVGMRGCTRVQSRYRKVDPSAASSFEGVVSGVSSSRARASEPKWIVAAAATDLWVIFRDSVTLRCMGLFVGDSMVSLMGGRFELQSHFKSRRIHCRDPSNTNCPQQQSRILQKFPPKSSCKFSLEAHSLGP